MIYHYKFYEQFSHQCYDLKQTAFWLGFHQSNLQQCRNIFFYLNQPCKQNNSLNVKINRTVVRLLKIIYILAPNYLNLRFFKYNIEAFALNFVLENW
jgi:hypothetical protein